MKKQGQQGSAERWQWREHAGEEGGEKGQVKWGFGGHCKDFVFSPMAVGSVGGSGPERGRICAWF